MFTEWYGIFSDGLEDEFIISVFNMGVDHYVTDDLVLDNRAGVGLTDDSDVFYWGWRRLPILRTCFRNRLLTGHQIPKEDSFGIRVHATWQSKRG